MKRLSIKIDLKFLMIASIALGVGACAPKLDNGLTAAGEAFDPAGNGEDVLFVPPSNTGIKNYEQIYRSMLAVSGTSPETQSNGRSLAQRYNEVRLQLPLSNEIASISPTHQVAIAKLATFVCEASVDDGNIRSEIWPMVDFNVGPAQLSSGPLRSQIIHATIDAFWGSNLSQLPSDSVVESELEAVLDEISASSALGENGQGTRDALTGLCAAALASSPVTVL